MWTQGFFYALERKYSLFSAHFIRSAVFAKAAILPDLKGLGWWKHFRISMQKSVVPIDLMILGSFRLAALIR
jgi:hypothetical protein